VVELVDEGGGSGELRAREKWWEWVDGVASSWSSNISSESFQIALGPFGSWKRDRQPRPGQCWGERQAPARAVSIQGSDAR
jgi:hypothetical protein